MININIDGLDETWKSFIMATATITVGLLAFCTAILTIIITHRNNKRNISFLLEKDKREHESRLKRDELEIAKDTREKQRAYNRILGSFLKVYHSYVKHKYLFNEDGVNNIPDQFLIQAVEKINNFHSEITFFKQRFSEEAEIIPELTIYLHEILDILGRFEILDANIISDPTNPNAQTAKLIFQRAHTFAVSKLLDEYFNSLIEKLAKKAEMSEEFLKELKEFNSKDTVQYNIEVQKEILERMLQSLSRQYKQEITLEDLIKM